jgi:hypothetical protein
MDATIRSGGHSIAEHESMVTLTTATNAAVVALKTLGEFLDAASASRYLDADAILRAKRDLLQTAKEASNRVVTAIDGFTVEPTIRSEARAARLHYKENLESALSDAGIPFRGQWPAYTIAEIVQILAEPEKDRVTMDGKRLDSIEVLPVIERIQTKMKELLERPFDVGLFIGVLEEAYREACAAGAHTFGQYVDIKRIANSVRDKMKSRNIDSRYNDAKFAVDVYRLQTGTPSLASVRIELSPAQNASGSIYIPSAGSGNYIAALRLVEHVTT